MDKRDLESTKDRYNKRLELLGATEESLGWTRNNNYIRFEYLINEWKEELNGSRICDFGCGYGDLFQYIRSQGIDKVDYTGIDINEKLIAIGRERHPEANFMVRNILTQTMTEEFDFTFSSGVFNHKLEFSDEYSFIESCIDEIAKFSKKGFAINFLSDKVEYNTQNNFNSNPGKIIELFYKHTNHVVLRNDYMPFEFTVYARMDKAIDREKLIYL